MRKFFARCEWLKWKFFNLHIRLTMPLPGRLTLRRDFPKIITKDVVAIDFRARQPTRNRLSRLIRKSLETDVRSVAVGRSAKIVAPAGRISL